MILKANHISKQFQQGSQVISALKNINFSINKGETVALVGTSGSGKTTLLSLIAGLDTPTDGTIEILGSNIAQLSADELSRLRAQHIGIVFQQFHLMPHLTALENIGLPLEILNETDITEKSLQALESVGLTHRANHLPSELSGGECQRVAIARALIKKPSLILADEPSGNLDSQTGESVMSLLFRLAQESQSALLLVTHDIHWAQKCQRQLKMQNGEWIA